MANGKRESLAAGDWTEAALSALAHGGLAAVAIEPLAKSLGTTKGSFYWHFADRNALLAAALELWEKRDTDQVLAGIDETQRPGSRLRNLLRLAFMSVRGDTAGGAGAIELALQASAAHPLVASTLARVTSRRLAALGRLYQSWGSPRLVPGTRPSSPTPRSSAMRRSPHPPAARSSADPPSRRDATTATGKSISPGT